MENNATKDLMKVNRSLGEIIVEINSDETDPEEISAVANATIMDMAQYYYGVATLLMELVENHPDMQDKKFLEDPVGIMNMAVMEHKEEP